MHRTTPPPARPRREAVLVLVHADQHVEIYADRHVDVHVGRIPAVAHRRHEDLAEQCAELLLPPRYRSLWRDDRLRAVGTTRPLSVEAAHESLIVRDQLAALDRLAAELQEVVAWTL